MMDVAIVHALFQSCVDVLEVFVKEQAETITKMASLSMALHVCT